MAQRTVSVYRLKYITGTQQITPAYMWGTVAAIESLGNCIPVLSSERVVDAESLDPHGFLFERTRSADLVIEDVASRGPS